MPPRCKLCQLRKSHLLNQRASTRSEVQKNQKKLTPRNTYSQQHGRSIEIRKQLKHESKLIPVCPQVSARMWEIHWVRDVNHWGCSEDTNTDTDPDTDTQRQSPKQRERQRQRQRHTESQRPKKIQSQRQRHRLKQRQRLRQEERQRQTKTDRDRERDVAKTKTKLKTTNGQRLHTDWPVAKATNLRELWFGNYCLGTLRNPRLGIFARELYGNFVWELSLGNLKKCRLGTFDWELWRTFAGKR